MPPARACTHPRRNPLPRARPSLYTRSSATSGARSSLSRRPPSPRVSPRWSPPRRHRRPRAPPPPPIPIAVSIRRRASGARRRSADRRSKNSNVYRGATRPRAGRAPAPPRLFRAPSIRARSEEVEDDDGPTHTNPSASRTAFGSNSSASRASASPPSPRTIPADVARSCSRSCGGEAGFFLASVFGRSVLLLDRLRLPLADASRRRNLRSSLLPVNLARGARDPGDLSNVFFASSRRARAGSSQTPPRTNPQTVLDVGDGAVLVRARGRRDRPSPPPRRSNVPRRAGVIRFVDVVAFVVMVSVSAMV